MRFNPGRGDDDEFDDDYRVSKYKDFLSEVEMLSHNNHKNVAKMVEAFRNQNGSLFIIMEYFKEGNLIEKRKRETKDRDRLYYSE